MSRDDPELLATLSDEELAATLALPSETMQAIERTLVENPRSTIEPAPATSSDAPGTRALDGLDALGDDRAQGILASLSMGRTLGEGGMGIVRMAVQRSLGRSVAVKTLRADKVDNATKLRLLREAWVTGALEHPNIVPVYDLGLDEEGRPVIVLKHIEGASWDTVIADPSVLEGAPRGRDALEQNLRILVQLCHAVSLAHSRSVLHRDIKPENVMLGRFGEVYLVDWGIAVSLVDDASGRLPRAKENPGIAGTPCYLAPEMLGIGQPLTERTDVYLLGATLHEILTGKPPHDHPGLRAIMASALTSKFTYGASVPEELARVAQKAMSRAPADRYATVHELRVDLERYLEDRGALALASAAEERLGELEALLASDDAVGQRERVYRLYAECRFGLRQALAASERCASASRALERAARAMVGFELDHGTADGAASLLAELDVVPDELRARVDEAVRRHRERVKKLEELETAHDKSLGRRTRVATASILSALWMVAPLAAGYYTDHAGPIGYGSVYVFNLAMIVLSGAVGVWARESMLRTLVNRRVVALVLVMYAGQLALTCVGHIMGLPIAQLAVLYIVDWFIVSCCLAVGVEPRLWPITVGYLAAAVVSAWRPAWSWWAMSLSSLVLIASVVRAWGSFWLDRPRIFGGPGVEGRGARRV
jgi:eukaryotic-like serine/threonine-protein kinase